MKTIIVTGGIGSGKSTVSAILRELGLTVIEADRVGHEIIERGTPGWQEVVTTFGADLLTPQQTIDRQKLAQKVFHNPEALKKLNLILHPKVNAEINARLQSYQKQGVGVVAIEVAIITPSDWIQKSDYIWVVKAPKDIILKRLCDRGMSESESLARMSFQPPVEEYFKRKLIIIENDGTTAELKAKVEKLWQEIHNEVDR
jgi:dephospho-CoA kinase